MKQTSPLHTRILAVVRKIPRGRVASYGQIARLAGLGNHARLVGYALHALPPRSGVPWHRVLNARGRISLPGSSAQTQLRLLEREGVRPSAGGAIDLATYQWRPSAPRASAQPNRGLP
jgi:methylated-DNA-protein-cysteine methyltransferase-like protein